MSNTPIDFDEARNDLGELDGRNSLLNEIEQDGGQIGTMRKRMMDYADFQDFKYTAYRLALKNAGVTIEHLPVVAKDATVSERESMNKLYANTFTNERVDASEIFLDCRDVREKISKLMTLSESQLIAVWDDHDLEYVVRSYAAKILKSDVKEMNSIVDQAIGKPVERHENLNFTQKNLGLSAEEIRQLLARGGEEQEIEAEAVEDV